MKHNNVGNYEFRKITFPEVPSMGVKGDLAVCYIGCNDEYEGKIFIPDLWIDPIKLIVPCLDRKEAPPVFHNGRTWFISCEWVLKNIPSERTKIGKIYKVILMALETHQKLMFNVKQENPTTAK